MSKEYKLKKNERIELVIIDMTKDGLGLAKLDGQVFFVKDGLIGDKVETIITKIDKNVIYAKVINIIEKSEFRVESVCTISNACGGCQLLNLDYSKQLEIKKNYVLSCLKNIAKLDDYFIGNENSNVIYEGIIPAFNIYNFRNKMQVPFSMKNGKIVYGFYASRTHSIIECEKCFVGFKGSDVILRSIKDVLKKSNISIYNENENKGIFREIMLRRGNTSNEVSITYIINDMDYNKRLKLYRDFDNEVLEKYEKYSSLESNEKLILNTSTININTNANNVIFGNKNIVIRGSGYIEDTIGDIKYHISPESFYQINIDMTKKLYDVIVEFADFTGKERVCDLFCGIGTISLYIAKYVKKVIGIEIVEKAIENAIENASLNGIKNVDFICKDLSKVNIIDMNNATVEEKNRLKVNKVYSKILMNKSETYDTIIIDPPRKGLDKNTISFIKAINPKKIIYVSCDPATFSRDIDILCNERDGIYRLVKIKNVDMFPHTMHIETIAKLEKI